ncbi:MAG: carboxypeptidase-like regulatory domain-containing protein, partial [Eudoraea sp.]|nr:carboxypeptidase-like regulatory domain-containing protein [Eudoraea sp.]
MLSQKSLYSALLCCFLCPLVLIGQNAVDEIKGVIKNENGELIELATISLFQDETRFISSTVSDTQGRFTLVNVEPGDYIIRIDHLLYATYESGKFYKSANKTLILPAITLSQSISELDEVVLVEQKEFIQVKADKIIFNVASSPSASGSNGLDLLKVSPGITVDFDNSISLLGKGNVQVYLNGVQSRLA